MDVDRQEFDGFPGFHQKIDLEWDILGHQA